MELKELKLLNLQECETVDDIVKGMCYCSFGARMLGEVAATLADMIKNGEAPLLIYDGYLETPLGKLLKEMTAKKWFANFMTPEEYQKSGNTSKNIVVVGPYSERFEKPLYTRPQRTIFINQFDMVKPGQVRDGYFPDVVFSDPRFIMPVLYYSFLERLENKPTSISEFITALKRYEGLSAEAANGAETLRAMVNDPECTVFFTLSGAMTIAKMGLIICDLIDMGMVHYIASTGALMAHGLVESVGLKHYKYDPNYDDEFLASQKLNRVTDTLEPETNLDQVEGVIDEILEPADASQPISPRILHQMIGKYLSERYPRGRGILKSAYEKNVPVAVPAFVDSEIGNDVYIHNYKRKAQGRQQVVMNMELDSALLVDMVSKAKRVGIFTLGGGVPRNNTQNIAPLIEIMNVRLNLGLPENPFFYGVKIAPDKMYYGHLGGCTYSEGMSWRKMDPSGCFGEIHADATQIFPFIVKYAMENRVKEISSTPEAVKSGV